MMLQCAAFSCRLAAVAAALLPLPRLTPFLHRDGSSALHAAAAGGHLETARSLLDAGADVNAKNG